MISFCKSLKIRFFKKIVMTIKRLFLILVFCLLTATSFAAEQVKYRLLLQVSEDSVDKSCH